MISSLRHANGIGKWPHSVAQSSDYIAWLPDLIDKDKTSPIVVYCRVSSPRQEKEGNLQRQLDAVRYKLERLGVTSRVIDVISGNESSRMSDNRLLLERATAIARCNNAILVAESRCRFLRSVHNDGSSQRERPTVRDMVNFRHIVNTVVAATIEHPDNSARSEQISRGQAASGNFGGRPRKHRLGYKREIRDANRSTALKLRTEGQSIRSIARALSIPKSTIARWLRVPET